MYSVSCIDICFLFPPPSRNCVKCREYSKRMVEGADGAHVHVETLRGESANKHMVPVRDFYDEWPCHGER